MEAFSANEKKEKARQNAATADSLGAKEKVAENGGKTFCPAAQALRRALLPLKQERARTDGNIRRTSPGFTKGMQDGNERKRAAERDGLCALPVSGS